MLVQYLVQRDATKGLSNVMYLYGIWLSIIPRMDIKLTWISNKLNYARKIC